MTDTEQNLIHLFKSWSGKDPLSVTKLPGSGSYRDYYRIQGEYGSVIGAHNNDIRENEAFIKFTTHFRNEGLPVPEILSQDPANRIYLITDLGDINLYQLLTGKLADQATGHLQSATDDSVGVFPSEVKEIYKIAIGWLPIFQVKAGKTLDYSVCYPRAAFDRQSMMWDLNYFKYNFLKLTKIPFDEQGLEDDFSYLCDILLAADTDFFLYRDFQSRNIMVLNGDPWFIDYQGGRKGALQYDIASLLSDGKANIPMNVRDELLHFYLDKLEEIIPVDREKFLRIYHGFVLIRILQALGAYGFRGYYEKKLHFLQSIPFAVNNLGYMRTKNMIDSRLKTLISIITKMVADPILPIKQSVEVNDSKSNSVNELTYNIRPGNLEKTLTVNIYSFSYKNSIPQDENGNGGGFVFDCRALPNPGRFDEFKAYNGKDKPVIDFLEKEHAVHKFLDHVFSMIDQSVRTYIDRDFTNLMVAFGCTGGQHRSVYCAEKLAAFLKKNHKVNIKLTHAQHNK
ncbi:MAG: RNase adapter RapZ [Bacteroidales bacterium]|nr:RNase adapter RapZ [Bacteroidales bacterium]